MQQLIIAVDFDGTIVENAYPNIGKPLIFAFDTLLKLQAEGHLLILWTYRAGERLQEAVDYCKENGLAFYAVNKSYPEEKISPKISRKIHADVFIDDRNVGGMRGWGEIYQELSHKKEEFGYKKLKKSPKRGIIQRIEDLFKED